jgi:hypothetical protein
MEKGLTRWTRNGTLKSTEPRHHENVQSSLKPNGETKTPDIQEEIQGTDTRLKMLKTKQHVMVPNLNRLYDSLRTPHAWRYACDAIATGNVTTSAGASVNSTVKLTFNKQWDANKWPFSPQLYLVFTYFSVAPRLIGTTAGNITVQYVDPSGYTANLGVFLSTTAFSNGNTLVIPTPITDMGVPNQQYTIGTLVFTTSSGTTTETYDWQLNVSTAYLLPANKGYDIKTLDHEEYTVHEKHH